MTLRLWIVLAAFALAACSTPGSITPGTPESTVRSSAGRPTATIALPDGGSRWQYSGQPWYQSVWNVDFDAAGKVVRTEQMMTDAAFAKIRSGRETRNEVLRDFGPPAESFSFPMVNETAFMYRYYDSAGWYAAMFVYFDPAGVVKRTETGMDPYRLRDSDRGK